MIHLNDEEVAERLPWPALVDAIDAAVRSESFAPPRLSYPIDGSAGEEGRLLVMPAWTDDTLVGIKLVTGWPSNQARGLPTHGASYILLDARSGEVRAMLAAEELTHRRTAAVSVLAARVLLPAGAERLLVVGTGPTAEQLVRAHAASGRFASIAIYGRNADRVAALVARVGDVSAPCEAAENLQAAVRSADMVVGATNATTPWLCGDWLRDHAHVDLIGSYTPDMREADDRVIERAAAIWVDTVKGTEVAGDIAQPLASGILDRGTIRGDLAALVTAGGPRPDGITLFKSAGWAVADLAAARLILAA